MKMHILERRDAILADGVITLIEEEAHRQILRRLLARLRRLAGINPARRVAKPVRNKERHIASQRDLKVRKANFALRKQASTSPENNCQIWHWAVCVAHLRVVQHTGLAQFFSGTATLAA